jgi:hypothetical protein
VLDQERAENRGAIPMRPTFIIRILAIAAAALGILLVPSASFANQSSNDVNAMFHGTVACDHNSPGDYSGLYWTGTVVAHRAPDGDLIINVTIRDGVPNASYHMSTACIGYFGYLTTNSHGSAAGSFDIASNSGADPGDATFHVNAYYGPANDRFSSWPLNVGT